jgi:hypothetical protein
MHLIPYSVTATLQTLTLSFLVQIQIGKQHNGVSYNGYYLSLIRTKRRSDSFHSNLTVRQCPSSIFLMNKKVHYCCVVWRINDDYCDMFCPHCRKTHGVAWEALPVDAEKVRQSQDAHRKMCQSGIKPKPAQYYINLHKAHSSSG